MSFKIPEKPKNKEEEKTYCEKIKEQRVWDIEMKASLTWLLIIFAGFIYAILYLFDLQNSGWIKYLLIAFGLLVLLIQWKYPTMDD